MIAGKMQMVDAVKVCGKTRGTMAGPHRRGVVAHGAALGLALAMLSDGRAKSKAHAAELAGVHVTSLKPKALAHYARNNPVLKQLTPVSPDLLAITADVKGKRVSMRTALSTGVESSICTIAKAGPRVEKLTKMERQRVKDAKMWLDLCRSCGLFATPQPLVLPSELQQPADSSPKPDGSVDEFLESHDEPDSSTEDEAVTEQHNVEA